MSQASSAATTLHRILDAESVAIVGASADPKKVGSRPVEYLLRAGYEGRVYPVNPNRTVINGLRCYPTLRQLPEVPDLVAVLVPADRVEEAVREAAEIGVPAVIVITSGFGEIDDAGRAAELRLATIARQHDMVLIGPNSVGVIHAPNRMPVTFTEALSRGPLARSGGIGMVSQSGAFGTIIYALARAGNLGLRTYVSTGNEAGFGLAEILRGMVEDPEIRVVGGYVEAIRDGEAFVSAASRANELQKPVVLVKVGTSAAGGTAASSHTGAIVGNDDVYEAAFSRHGVVRVEDEHHLLATLDTFDIWYSLPTGNRVAVVSMSGGAGVLLCDDLERRGVEVVQFPDSLVKRLAEMLPPFASLNNPVDLTGQFVANNEGLKEVLIEIARSDSIDAVLLFAGVGWTGDGAWAQSVVDAKDSGAPIMVVTQLASDETMMTLREAGVPVFDRPVQASRVLSSVVHWSTRTIYEAPEPIKIDVKPEGDLTEGEAKSFLETVGIRTPRRIEASTAEEAQQLAAELGVDLFAVKIQGPEIKHKTELGGVVLDVPTARVAEVCHEMAERVESSSVAAGVTGFLVEEMAPEGADFMIGAVWEEPFGHLMVVGPGGRDVELNGDVAFGIAPVGVNEAYAMVRSLRSFPLLQGHRGANPLDTESLVQALSRISGLCAAMGPTLSELDVNPIRILPHGDGALALDVLIRMQDRLQEEPRSRAGSRASNGSKRVSIHARESNDAMSD